MCPVEYYLLLVKKILMNLVDSIEQNHYSRVAYFCGQNGIGTRCLEIFLI